MNRPKVTWQHAKLLKHVLKRSTLLWLHQTDNIMFWGRDFRALTIVHSNEFSWLVHRTHYCSSAFYCSCPGNEACRIHPSVKVSYFVLELRSYIRCIRCYARDVCEHPCMIDHESSPRRAVKHPQMFDLWWRVHIARCITIFESCTCVQLTWASMLNCVWLKAQRVWWQ